MSQTEKLYEGKAKILYTTDDPDILLTVYKDDATAFNAQKKGQITGKGAINCQITAALYELLESLDISTHYVDCPQPDRMRVKAVTIVPVEVVVRNIAAGSLCRQTGLPEGKVLDVPLVEYYYKSDELGDPLLTRDRIFLLDLVSDSRLAQIEKMARKINQHLQSFFDQCDIILVDFKLEFGIDSQQNLLLADEISPDTCRLWDKNETDPTAKVMDKDRFRKDLGRVESAYQQVQQRVLAQIKKNDCS
ncbi:phosphoribosylaminoimidazolesuccinocarboxamide synthase [Waterburya agarophytonicola K14]|uniref:Phosphoribosylaminoimidazole-succinocarboxamide synthase n=1 Tax=Waterburya agarophytonicola KI4 TaxID=2874699 RepID=A0A964FGP6_9CYAN|nr:phosphoribosylaminoimidazolesuccinocarboxamide synthase [Waterburya agarophytonicola]MCC0176728.1 phosphoribosylaminoimidazolesuccinocarboxamide synthase [Waterburya agarophytonicola KI4]